MSFVFISHASEDKPRLRPIVDALRAQGLRVFLDSPDRADYSPEEVASGSFVRLHYDRSWDQQLKEALRASHCVLICWSKSAQREKLADERDIWRAEIDYALISGKAVNVIIDDVAPSALYKGGGEHQCFANTDTIHERWHAAITQLVQDIRRKLDEVGLATAKARTSRRKDPDLPIYADRHAQENAFNDALGQVEEQGGACPIILYGPENELPEGFMKRATELSGDRTAEGAGWHEVRSPYWPQQARTRQAFQDAYRMELVNRLGCRGAEPDRRIAERLSREQVTAIVHTLKARDWERDERDRLKAWTDYWRELAAAHPHIRALPVLIAPLGKAEPTWHKATGKACHPPGRTGGPVDNPRASRTLSELPTYAASTGSALRVLEILVPLRRRDAEQWLIEWQDRLSEDAQQAAQTRIGQLFGKRGFWGFGPQERAVAHADFCEHLKDICTSAPASANIGSTP